MKVHMVSEMVFIHVAPNLYLALSRCEDYNFVLLFLYEWSVSLCVC